MLPFGHDSDAVEDPGHFARRLASRQDEIAESEAVLARLARLSEARLLLAITLPDNPDVKHSNNSCWLADLKGHPKR